MTIFAFRQQQQGFVALSDTLTQALRFDFAPSGYCTKTSCIPHLKAVFGGAGDASLLTGISSTLLSYSAFMRPEKASDYIRDCFFDKAADFDFAYFAFVSTEASVIETHVFDLGLSKIRGRWIADKWKSNIDELRVQPAATDEEVANAISVLPRDVRRHNGIGGSLIRTSLDRNGTCTQQHVFEFSDKVETDLAAAEFWAARRVELHSL